MDYTHLKPIAGAGRLVAYTGTATVNSGNSVAPKAAIAVRVTVSSDAYVCIDKNKTTATSTDTGMLSGTTAIFRCEEGDNISAVQQSAGGNLTYCWMC